VPRCHLSRRAAVYDSKGANPTGTSTQNWGLASSPSFESIPHCDYLGGAFPIINAIPVKMIFDSGQTYSGRAYRDATAAAHAHGIPVVLARRGMRWNSGDGVTLDVLAPSTPHGSQPSNGRTITPTSCGDSSRRCARRRLGPTPITIRAAKCLRSIPRWIRQRRPR
jgi:hypothetical protein